MWPHPPIEAPQKVGRKGELQNVEDHQQEQREEFGPAISALLPIHAWGLKKTRFFLFFFKTNKNDVI